MPIIVTDKNSQVFIFDYLKDNHIIDENIKNITIVKNLFDRRALTTIPPPKVTISTGTTWILDYEESPGTYSWSSKEFPGIIYATPFFEDTAGISVQYTGAIEFEETIPFDCDPLERELWNTKTLQQLINNSPEVFDKYIHTMEQNLQRIAREISHRLDK